MSWISIYSLLHLGLSFSLFISLYRLHQLNTPTDQWLFKAAVSLETNSFAKPQINKAFSNILPQCLPLMAVMFHLSNHKSRLFSDFEPLLMRMIHNLKSFTFIKSNASFSHDFISYSLEPNYNLIITPRKYVFTKFGSIRLQIFIFTSKFMIY
jgi:hypothetical protein